MDRAGPTAATPAAAPAGAPPPVRALGAAAAAFAVAGHLVLLVHAGLRLLRLALLQLSQEPAAPWTWVGAAAALALIWYGMGYRGFQHHYGPFVVARAAWLARHARPWQAALAPLVAAGLAHATRRRRLRTTVLFGVMTGLALLSRTLPEPTRACVRLGVAAGLLWGALAMAVLAARAVAGRPPPVALDLPGPRVG